MELGLIAIAAVVVLVGTSILGGRLRVAAPLLLVVVGIGAGYLPFVPLIRVDPEVILVGVLPPLLYAAAVHVPIVDFRRNFTPVAGLSVVLVLISALVIGLLLHALVPEIPFPVAVALGAVVSPTDAVAATSIGKRLGMPDRDVTILEGESLVNDATSLVLLKTAVAAAAATGSFSIGAAAGSFLFSVAAAVVIGYLVGVLTVWIRSKLNNPVYDTLLSFVVPFVAFFPAEELHASGVLAVVVTGLYTGHHAAQRFSATARINERLNWHTVQFVLENGVFLLIGLELHALVVEVAEGSLAFVHVIMLSLLVVVALILLRAAFVTPLLLAMRGTARRLKRRGDGFSRIGDRMRSSDEASTRQLRRIDLLTRRAEADLQHERDQKLTWRDGAVLSWSGMRGVVTLAAAQSIPTEVPHRAQLVLIAFIVAVVTLLLHGLSLPALIRGLWPNGAGAGADASELASLSGDLVEAANTAIDEEIALNPLEKSKAAEHATMRARVSARNSLASLAFSLPSQPAADGPESPGQAYLRLARIALEAQRDALLEERAIGRYSSQAIRAAERALDSYESRLTPPTSH